MNRACLALVCVALAAAPAAAGSVTVVTTGDAELQATVAKVLEGWLRGHGHTVAPSLPVDAASTLQNCMAMDDQGCARGVVDAQAKGDSVLYVQAIKSRANNAIVFNIYWFPKGKEPVGMRRACEECSADLMKSSVDEMLGMVVGAAKLERGRLALHSKPEGMTVLLDNETIGVTPLEREVPAGQHTIVLMHRGQRVGERTLKLHPDVTAEITIPVTLPTETAQPGPRGEGSSPMLGGIVIGLGAATLAAGVALYLTSEEDDGTKLYYRDTKTLGIGVAAGGAVIAGLGVWLYVRARGSADESGPTVSVTPNQGVLGWSRAF